LPPLSEQKRIIAILDRTFKAIDQAKTNSEQNLKNAKELFESYLQNIFKNNNWERYKIENLTSLITKGSSPNWQGVNYVENSGIFFLTSKNVGEGELLLKNKKYLEEKFNKIQKTSILKKGDVLTNIVGASIGRTAIFDLEEVTNINQAVCLMRCLPNKTYNYYLMYLLNSPFFKNILHNNEVNNARANLSLTFFKHLLIPVPELSEQIKITERIKQFLSETKKLETIYQQKINNLVELKKSILQQAFKGEL
jgi:restriction endonuclease S subunit